MRFGVGLGARVKVRRSAPIDASIYFKAFALLARNPALIVAPLAMALAVVLIGFIFPGTSGAFGALNAGIEQFIDTLLYGFGLGVALIGADAAWRRGRAPFDEAWEEGRRKLAEILMATIGFTFVLFAASYVGGIFTAIGGILLMVVAAFFFIYTLPAAAIGGIPGGAALQVSLERARSAPLPTAIVFVASGVAYFVIPTFLATKILELLAGLGVPSSSFAISQIVVAFVQAIAAAYVALVLAKTYNDISYRRYY